MTKNSRGLSVNWGNSTNSVSHTVSVGGYASVHVYWDVSNVGGNPPAVDYIVYSSSYSIIQSGYRVGESGFRVSLGTINFYVGTYTYILVLEDYTRPTSNVLVSTFIVTISEQQQQQGVVTDMLFIAMGFFGVVIIYKHHNKINNDSNPQE